MGSFRLGVLLHFILYFIYFFYFWVAVAANGFFSLDAACNSLG